VLTASIKNMALSNNNVCSGTGKSVRCLPVFYCNEFEILRKKSSCIWKGDTV
jgi:hypothetical protein